MSLRILDELVSVIASRLQPWNLQVNEGKTEKITIKPGTRDQARFKKLGSQIDRDLDVTHRIERANICFYALLKLWARSLTAAPINKRMHIYNVCVKTALLYNIEATVLTEASLQKLEAAHRRHIRCLLKIRWLERISNWRLYETSGATSPRKEIMVR